MFHSPEEYSSTQSDRYWMSPGTIYKVDLDMVRVSRGGKLRCQLKDVRGAGGLGILELRRQKRGRRGEERYCESGSWD